MFKKYAILLLFLLASSSTALYSMEEDESTNEKKTVVQMAQAFEDTYTRQDQNQLQSIISSIIAQNSPEDQLTIITSMIPVIQNTDLITYLCTSLTQLVVQQQQNEEFYNYALKDMEDIVIFLIEKNHLPGLSQLVALYVGQEQWTELCATMRLHINALVAENFTRGYSLKRKSDTFFYKESMTETKKQKTESAPTICIPSLAQLCTFHLNRNIQLGCYDQTSKVLICDLARQINLPHIEKLCFDSLYKKAQKKNKKGTLNQWLKKINLTKNQIKAFKQYIINNSATIQDILFNTGLSFSVGKLKYKNLSNYFKEAKYSSQAELLATVADRTSNSIRLFDLKAEKIFYILKGKQDYFLKMEFSTDGKKLISISGLADKTICLWDCKKGSCIKEVTIQKELVSGYTCLALTADNQKAAFGFDNGTIKLYDLVENSWREFNGNNYIEYLKFLSNNNKLASKIQNESFLSQCNQVIIWDCQTGSSFSVGSRNFNSFIERKLLASKDSDTFFFKNYEDTKCHQIDLSISPDAQLVGFFPDKRIFVTSYKNDISLWDYQTGALVKKLNLPYKEEITYFDFCPNGKSFVCMSKNTIYFYDFDINKDLVAHFDLETLLLLDAYSSANADPIMPHLLQMIGLSNSKK